MLLSIQQYVIYLTYIPGKSVALAAALSRAPCEIEGPTQVETSFLSIHITATVPLSDPAIEELWQQTKADTHLQDLIKVIKDGWPESSCKRDLPPSVLPYFNYRDELVEEAGVIFKSNCCVVPFSMRKEVLKKKIHASHLGLESCFRPARDSVFWPGIFTAQIKDTVKQCDVCCSLARKQSKEPLKSWPVANYPWEMVEADIFHLKGTDVLIVVDYFSNFWEIDWLTSITSAQVILHLRRQFGRYGIPVTFVSDNGPQFASKEFQDFARSWGFVHITSSPEYPRSTKHSIVLLPVNYSVRCLWHPVQTEIWKGPRN